MCNFDNKCQKIHELISLLPKFNNLKVTSPLNGLYFFFEDGEYINCSNQNHFRIVRVGNHIKINGLIKRLRKHYTGSKKNSPFLRYVGGAMIRKDNPYSTCLQPEPGQGHWEMKNGKYCKLCEPYKKKSKEYIKTRTKFSIVQVDDKEIRDILEKTIVSTISLYNFHNSCIPSENWLGKYAYSDKVKSSGLWQIDFVPGTKYELSLELLNQFEKQVQLTIKFFNDNK